MPALPPNSSIVDQGMRCIVQWRIIEATSWHSAPRSRESCFSESRKIGRRMHKLAMQGMVSHVAYSSSGESNGSGARHGSAVYGRTNACEAAAESITKVNIPAKANSKTSVEPLCQRFTLHLCDLPAAQSSTSLATATNCLCLYILEAHCQNIQGVNSCRQQALWPYPGKCFAVF